MNGAAVCIIGVVLRVDGMALPHRMVEMAHDALVLRQVRFPGRKGHVCEEFKAVIVMDESSIPARAEGRVTSCPPPRK